MEKREFTFIKTGILTINLKDEKGKSSSVRMSPGESKMLPETKQVLALVSKGYLKDSAESNSVDKSAEKKPAKSQTKKNQTDDNSAGSK